MKAEKLSFDARRFILYTIPSTQQQDKVQGIFYYLLGTVS
jgi:hypothetical protein